MKGLNVVVTGASSGLGEEIAYQFASMGAKLFVTARTETKLQKVRRLYVVSIKSAYFLGTVDECVFLYILHQLRRKAPGKGVYVFHEITRFL